MGTAGKENGTCKDVWQIDYLDPTQKPTFISIPYGKPKVYQQGWVCPKCGAVMSPTTNECPHCSPKGTFTC